MTICAICGRLLPEPTDVCPSGHKSYADAAAYARELQRTSHTVDVRLANDLCLTAKIQMVTEDGVYLDDINFFTEPVKYTWSELASISKSV